MSEEKTLAAKPIKRWQIVYLDTQGEMMPFLPPDSHCQPIGTAKRDIAKGEVVVYSRGRSTDDIEAVVRLE